MRLTVRPRVLLVLLLPVAVALALTSLLGHLWGLATPGGVPFDGYERLMEVVDVDRETTVPSWFSASLLLLCAVLLLDVARTARAERDRWRRHWVVLTVAFAYLSVDEGSRLHETGSALLDRAGVDTGLRFAWVVLAVPVVAVFVLAMLPFLARLPRRTAVSFVVAGAVYVGSAVGLELVGGRLVDATSVGTAPYVVVSSLEELGEMVGATLFAWAVADHQRRHLAAAAAAHDRAVEPDVTPVP
ncbi:hypothetical protein WDZ17_11365 [Pseudokineococcus basanitobsidens]|uniref:Uncharacterized protein n=1 Tax=Pseudokineococcus basanitobsidens TaxID=1926649 RepID=A0ABU8RLF0_9ACTN